jgi:signal transduction histidine kinase
MRADGDGSRERIRHLNEAFSSFTATSGRLERYYEQLRETVRHLTIELEDRNARLQAALADAENAKDHLRCVLQSMAEAIIVLDRDGNVTMVNRAASELLGPAAEKAVGGPFAALELGLGKDGAGTYLSTGGKRYDIIVSRSDMVELSGGVRGSVVVIQDITKMKEVEAQYERNRRLIRMGEMAAKIVHEIRSPLCSIELYATMLESELRDGEPTNLARGISSGILSVNNILTNMLLFAKQQNPACSRIDAEGVVDAALRLLEPMTESRGIRIDRRAVSGPCLDGDAELVKQVLLNVILNAVQATPGGGSIGVSVRDEGGGAVIEISDTGEGIREEDRDRIFDPFFTTKVKGTGLGLAIASRIMQAHGGFIRLRSELGRGSTFGLHFPPPVARNEGGRG